MHLGSTNILNYSHSIAIKLVLDDRVVGSSSKEREGASAWERLFLLLFDVKLVSVEGSSKLVCSSNMQILEAMLR